MLQEGIIPAISGQFQYESRVLLIGRYGEKETIAVADACSPVPMAHDLPNSLRALQVLCFVADFPRELLLARCETIWIRQLRRVAVDRNSDISETLATVPELVA